MMEDHRKYIPKGNENKYFFQKEIIQTKPSNPKSSQAANNLLIKSEQKHQKTLSLHKFPNSFIKEVELSDESFSKPSINKSSLGLPLNNAQPTNPLEKKRAINDKISKTYRGYENSRNLTPEPFCQNPPPNSNSNGKPPISERNLSFCKSCKDHEENLKKVSQILNSLVFDLTSLNELESLWRNGNFCFENERIGSTAKNENVPPEVTEDKDFLETECGKLCQKLQGCLWRNRIKFEDLILDVENLSKMSPFLEIELKENKDLSNSKKGNLSATNPSEKLLENLKEARSCLEMLKGTVLKNGMTDSFLREIRNLQNRKAPDSKEVLQTLRLQLEQSMRERRYLMIETSVLRKQIEGQKGGGLDILSLRKNIREIVENEIKTKKNIDVSLSSSFNINLL